MRAASIAGFLRGLPLMMKGPRSIQAQCASIMVAHLASATGRVAKVRYLDALHAKLKERNVKSTATLDICSWCQMPMVENFKTCKRCANYFPCGGPYCLSPALATKEMPVVGACIACGKSGLCPNCADASGCVNCGKTYCAQCAYVHKRSAAGTEYGRERVKFTICTEECARKTAKRARTGE